MLIKNEKLINTQTTIGEASTKENEEVVRLKKGLMHSRNQNKALQPEMDKLKMKMYLKPPTFAVIKENQKLEVLLKTVSNKFNKVEEAYKQAMDLYMSSSTAPPP